MERTVLLSRAPGQTRLAVMEDGRLAEYAVLLDGQGRLAGNVYLARVRNIAPSLNAAFVDIGYIHNAMLPLGEGGGIIRPGDEIVAQVSREPEGDKGPRVTRRISLPGRLVAVTADAGRVGVSKKIEDDGRREALRSLITDNMPSDVGWIVRTSADGEDDAAILRDASDALAMWREVERLSLTAKPPALLHANDDLSERIARDLANDRLIACHVEDAELFDSTRAAFGRFAGAYIDRVRLYREDAPLFERFGVESQAEGILDRRVGLKGGGFLLVEPCETLTAIDVNSGQDARRRTERENVLAVNLEAAEVAARRIRLRDLGGVILIDFIDMREDEDRASVRARFEECARDDRGRIRVYGFTRCGLLELTRKKTDMPLDAVLTEPCPTCEGVGFIPRRQ